MKLFDACEILEYLWSFRLELFSLTPFNFYYNNACEFNKMFYLKVILSIACHMNNEL